MVVQIRERHNKPVNACAWSCSTRFTALEEWSRAVNRVLHSAHALTITKGIATQELPGHSCCYSTLMAVSTFFAIENIEQNVAF